MEPSSRAEANAQASRPALKATSLVDALCEAVRDEIFSAGLAPGTLVTEMGLSTRYGVARPTAKAALERLRQEGLLRRDQNRTARVPLLTEEDMTDLYRSRGFLERAVVHALAVRRHVPPAALDAHTTFKSAISDQSLTKLVQTDVAFHLALLDALGSVRLSQMYRTLMGEMRLCMAQVQSRQLLAPDKIAEEHARLLEAINSGDPERATHSIDEHLEAALQELRQFIRARESASGS